MSDTMSGQLLEGWSMVSAILFFFFWFFEVFAIFPKMQKASKNQKKTKCQTLCLASSWKGGPWCLPFCFFFLFFWFFEVSAIFPKMQKASKNKKKQKKQNVRHYVWPALGRVVHGVCHFFFVFRGFCHLPKNAKSFEKPKKNKKKNKMSDTMSGQLLEGWSMVSAILFFFLFFLVFRGFCHLPKNAKSFEKPKNNKKKQNVRHYVWPALGRVVHGVCHFVFFVFLVFRGFCHLCLASSWKGGPWCLTFFFVFFLFSRFLSSSKKETNAKPNFSKQICRMQLFGFISSHLILDSQLISYCSMSLYHPPLQASGTPLYRCFFWYADVLVPHLQRFDSCSLNLQYRYINLLLFQK